MDGGTTFTFVTDGIESALEQAVNAADGEDIRLWGGPGIVAQYLRAGLVDELKLAIVPMLLGRRERLWDNLDGGSEGLECDELVGSAAVTHIRFVRR
jgi:dihydrofolate reductase